jgi:RecA-family ATPase
MYRCVAALPNVGGNCIEHFYLDTPEGHQTAETFVQRHNRPGWGVYDCVSLLREERRNKEAVAEISGLHLDFDERHVGESKDIIVQRLREKFADFGILSILVDSGRGIHAYIKFREPIEGGTPEAIKANEVLRRLATHLGADMAPTHFAALMRRPGTENSKEGGGPCKVVIDTGARCELDDVISFLDLVEGKGPLFQSPTANNGDAGNGAGAADAPVDVEARLAAMEYKGEGPRGVNETCKSVIPALIWKAWHPQDIFDKVHPAIMAAAERAGATWNERAEVEQTHKRIASGYRRLFEKEYDPASGVPVWLPMEFHPQWAAALAEGRRPAVSRNGAGWHIRSYGVNERLPETDDAPLLAPDAPKEDVRDEAPKAPFVLRPFKLIDGTTLPPREFLFGRHYQRRTVSGTVAPGGTGKSSLVMVESIAMATGRNLLDEEIGERVRVWYHNGEDNMTELERRVLGICQHYNIPQEELPGWFFMTSGNEVPLRVAESWNQVRLNTDHRLVKCITEAIGDNKIDVCALDPLVTLHGVRESDPGQMDSVIRIFTRIADTQNCAIDLSHHTRKLASGSTADDYTVDDMRGAKAISDAMRAVRMLNVMSPKDAENAGLMELERTNYFRIDRAKANYSGPAKTATWRQFTNVDLPNGDGVGVVTPWLFPGQDGPPSPEKLEAERKAEHVFLEILRRLSLAGVFVNDRGTHNAPHVFAKEREAKMAKVGKAALDAAMRRLFDKGKIRKEDYIMANRHAGSRIVEI